MNYGSDWSWILIKVSIWLWPLVSAVVAAAALGFAVWCSVVKRYIAGAWLLVAAEVGITVLLIGQVLVWNVLAPRMGIGSAWIDHGVQVLILLGEVLIGVSLLLLKPRPRPAVAGPQEGWAPMNSFFDVHHIVSLLLVLTMAFVDLAVAAVAFYRLRSTLSGILIGGAFALMAVKALIYQVAYELWLRPAMMNSWQLDWEAQDQFYMMQNLFSVSRSSISQVLLLLLGLGIVLLPLSLRKLERRGALS